MLQTKAFFGKSDTLMQAIANAEEQANEWFKRVNPSVLHMQVTQLYSSTYQHIYTLTYLYCLPHHSNKNSILE